MHLKNQCDDNKVKQDLTGSKTKVWSPLENPTLPNLKFFSSRLFYHAHIRLSIRFLEASGGVAIVELHDDLGELQGESRSLGTR